MDKIIREVFQEKENARNMQKTFHETMNGQYYKGGILGELFMRQRTDKIIREAFQEKENARNVQGTFYETKNGHNNKRAFQKKEKQTK